MHTRLLTRNVLRNREGGLSERDRAILEGYITSTYTLRAGELVVRQGKSIDTSTLLIEGFMSRHVDAADGRRHLVGIHVPGDFVDLHAYLLGHLDHDVGALGDTTVATVPHAALDAIVENEPELARRLWFITALDAALHRQWVFRHASLNAAERVAHFLCETHARMLAIGAAENGSFELPMTQADIGEVCSLTNVHVSRVLRQLRELGLCTVKSARVDVHDVARLARLGQFSPDYLYLEPACERAAGGAS